MLALTVRGRFVHSLLLSALVALSACGGGEAPVGGAGGQPPPTAPGSQPPVAGANVSLFAGAVRPAGSADGVGVEARFNGPAGVAQDSAGNVYVADTGNHVIRRIAPDQTVTTFAGAAGQAGSTDGPRTGARFRSPEGVAVDAAGVVYVADTGNSTIRRIDTGGVVSTVAGVAGQAGTRNGTGAGATFQSPRSVAVDSASRTLYVAGGGLRKISSAGAVSTFASDSQMDFVAVDGAGNVYGARPGSASAGPAGRVYKFNAQGQAMPLGGSTEGVEIRSREVTFTGGIVSAGIAADQAGNVYVAANRVVLKIGQDGAVVALAGNESEFASTDGAGTVARFRHARGISVGPGGRVVLTEPSSGAIRQIDSQGMVSTLAGGEGDGNLDGQGISARFLFPTGIAASADGSLFVGDSGNRAVRRISPTGLVSTVATIAGSSYVAVDPQGTLYVTDANLGTRHPIYAISPSGQVRAHAQIPEVTTSLATAADGKLYVGTQGSVAVLNADGSRNRTIAGTSCAESSMVDSGALLYLACPGQHTVRSIDAQGRSVIVAGQAGKPGTVDGAVARSQLEAPDALALDGSGNLYIADAGTIRRMSPNGEVRTIAAISVAQVPGRARALAWSAGALYLTVPHGVLKVTPLN